MTNLYWCEPFLRVKRRTSADYPVRPATVIREGLQRTMLRSLIRWNFRISVWLTVGLCVAFLLTFDPSHSPRSGRAAVGPALIAFFEMALWFVWYREDEGQVPAALIGAILIAPAVAGYLLPQVSERPIESGPIFLLGYLAASHFIWALFSRPLLPKKVTDL